MSGLKSFLSQSASNVAIRVATCSGSTDEAIWRRWRYRHLGLAVLPLAFAWQMPVAQAAPPTFLNVCTGLGVSLPVLTPIAQTTDGLLSGLLAPVLTDLNQQTNSVNVNLTQALSGQRVGLTALNPSTGQYAAVPTGQCNLSADGVEINNNLGISIGGGQIVGLGGTAGVAAIAGDPSAIAFGNSAVTAGGAVNAIAIGTSASAAAADAVSLGAHASAGVANASALGTGSSVTATGGVALGANSIAGRAAATYVDPFSGASITTTVGAVSVGQAGQERQITNVAAGLDATDAVNVAQVQAAVSDLGASVATTLGGGATFNVATGVVTTPTFTIRGAGYNSVSTAFGAVDTALGVIEAGTVGAFVSNNAANLAASVATGANASAGGFGASATGIASTVVGNGASDHGVANSTVLGNGASIAVGLVGSNIALGQGSAAETGAQTNYTAFGDTASQTAVGEVSIGSVAGGQRLLTNLAAGISDTDAANVGQLKGVSFSLGTSIANTIGGGSAYNTTTGAITAPSFTIQGNTYTTIGGALSALNGSLNSSGTSNNQYVQVNSTGGGASASGTNAIAAGSTAVASGANATAIGNAASATGQNSVALGAGSSDGGQANVVSVGSAGAERRITNVAEGTISSTSTDAINGSQLYATNTTIASLGHASVQYDTGVNGGTLSSISLSSDQGGPVIIHNLAAGVAASDAATVGQVQAASAGSVQYTTVNGVKSNTVNLVGGSAGTVTIGNLGPGLLGTDAVNLNQLQSYSGATLTEANAYTNQQISNLAALTGREIAQARADAAAGSAIALAATGIRYDDRPGHTSIGGATSYYQGQAGLAFGLGATSEDGRVRVNATLSGSPTMSHPEVGAVVGASIDLD